MVEIKGERVLAPSCCRYPKDGMEVTTDSPRALVSQKMSIELLLSDIPETAYTLDSELDLWAKKLDIGKPRFAARPQPAQDLSHPAIAVQPRRLHPVQPLRARLPRRAGQRRHRLRVPRQPVEDRVRPRRPDGRLHLRRLRRVRPGVPDRRADAGARGRRRSSPNETVDSVCPYCGVGCQLTYNVKDNTILYVQGKDGPANSSRLCVKGRYGFDYVQHRHRLTKPLIRKPGVPKHKDFAVDPGQLAATSSARPPGKRRSTSPPRACATSATPTASARSPASARPRAPTKRRTCSRSWCAPASGRTTSTTARACATPRASRR